MKMTVFYSVVFLVLFMFFSCSKEIAKSSMTRTVEMMSTIVRITAVGDNKTNVEKIIDETVEVMDSLASHFNIYDPHSEISKINRMAAIAPVKMSLEMRKTFHAAGHAHDETDGYFDVTVGPLVKIWKKAKKTGVLPSEADIEKAKNKVDFKDVIFDDETVFFNKKRISVDLGGIAKGIVLSRAVAFMKEKGIESGLVDIGGDLYAWGEKANGKKWRIGVRHPRNERSYLMLSSIKDKAFLTSGDYERYFMKEGKRYSHIVNPFTGKPDSDIISVTILGPNIMDIDGLSSGLLAMGSQKAIAKCKQFRKESKQNDYLIAWQDEKGEIKVWSTMR